MTVGERIRQVRESARMSQDELAKRMGYKDRSSISKIEKGNDDNIYLDTVQKVAEILNCSPLYLMGWDNDSEKPLSKEDYEFIVTYRQLSDEQKKLVDNMLTVLSSKQ
jgi:transcriptional regulator with XRE-family HTH domain